MENGLTFLGLVLLENKMKADSKQTIEDLNLAKISVKMITGDNIMTAVNIGYQCRILQENDLVKCLDLDDN